MNRKALGKGLRAIIPEKTQEALATESRPIPIDEIRPNPYQPRITKEAENNPRFQELVASIREKGVLQPVVVRRRHDGYELVMGERRWRAARLAGLTAIPAIIRPVDDREMLEMALIENIQRSDLNPIDEALAYKALHEQFNLTHEEIARRVGKDRSTITNALRLLTLPYRVREALSLGQITPGHARALLTLTSRREQVDLCERVIAEGISVRTLERLCSEGKIPTTKGETRKTEKDIHLTEIEQRLQETLGTRVVITPPGKSAGKITIMFHSWEDLTRICQLIRKESGG
ncbi:MAG: ParB/RepB/Spo0J family partition protein [candidate division WOR-3 bacterium]|uniref:ParB/RepB/Spo0J family partition protein n=1 Tax=candidate division WOR-3 bacterium TaxID=2052148 RepID=A0A7C3F155_UNCW3|nr:ParB/RepB/Spo0J family partition protein [candidate division WOR-3 bacterium]